MLRKIAKEKHTKYNKDKGISTTFNKGFPGDAVDKNMAAKFKFNPWFGKNLHATEQLSSCATTTGPTYHNY